MRGLHTASEDLLQSLTTFRAAEWTPERRQAWIEQARSFDRSRDIWADLSQRIFALRELPLGTDGEALALRSRLIGLAEEVAHTGQSEASPEELRGRTEGLDWHQAGTAICGSAPTSSAPVGARGGPDVLLKNFLPALMWVVTHADDAHPEHVKALRAIANGLRVTRTLASDEPIERVVRDADEIFGSLSGHLLGNHPKLPEPEWRRAG